MTDTPEDLPETLDAPSRRHLLKCSAWAGTGVAWAMAGGVPRAFALDAHGKAPKHGPAVDRFLFVQISDTHIGFNKDANPEPLKTLGEAKAKILAMSTAPKLIIHTGDISHLSRADEFDTADQFLRDLPAPVRFVPGEHDTLDEGGGKLYLERYGKGTKGNGWYSYDLDGVHFIALVNVFDFKPNQEASLGAEQLAWLKDDLRAVSKSTPIVVYTHIPLWDIYAPWGWGTSDSELAIAMLRPYGSVTVLNGHIHQIMQKVEGNITFHTGRGTAYPQPAPGTAPSPGPLVVAPQALRHYLGVSSVLVTPGATALAIHDTALSDS